MLHSVQHALISCRRLRAGHLWWSELHANSRHVRSAQQGQTDLPYWSVPHVLRQGRRLHSGRGLRCGILKRLKDVSALSLSLSPFPLSRISDIVLTGTHSLNKYVVLVYTAFSLSLIDNHKTAQTSQQHGP